ncbi:hypothetical protein GCM10023405_29380 [Streptomonospora salina]
MTVPRSPARRPRSCGAGRAAGTLPGVGRADLGIRPEARDPHPARIVSGEAGGLGLGSGRSGVYDHP